MKTTNKKTNNRKKILPAAGMLAVSAAMLGTATFAWFTMSREVEVNNIKMTATVPEDLQISLGHLTNMGSATGDATVSTAPSLTGLSGNQGILKGSGSSTADDGNVQAPNSGTDAVSMLDWASTADVSEYYRIGKIIPASSIDGQNIYFTPDASGVGKTIKAGARYYQAADISEAKNEVAATGRTATADAPDNSLKTKLHAITAEAEATDKWNDGSTDSGNTYKTATAWNVTNDDGYYVDIPVWIRSSAKDPINLSVDAYVTTTQAKDDDDLYLAARAVILYNTAGGTSAADKTSNLLRIRQDSLTNTQSIVNYMYTTNSTGDAVNSDAGAYADAVEYRGTGIIPVAAGANNTYGPMTKAIVRVWLEGEDPNCWNSNAGQDFTVNLMFKKEAMTDEGDSKTYPVSAIDHTNRKSASDSGSLQAGARVMVKSSTTPSGATEALTDELQFEYNGTKWSLVTDGSFHKYEGFNYKLGDTTINTSDDIAGYLLDTVTNQSIADAHNTSSGAYVVTVTAQGS